MGLLSGGCPESTALQIRHWRVHISRRTRFHSPKTLWWGQEKGELPWADWLSASRYQQDCVVKQNQDSIPHRLRPDVDVPYLEIKMTRPKISNPNDKIGGLKSKPCLLIGGGEGKIFLRSKRTLQQKQKSPCGENDTIAPKTVHENQHIKPGKVPNRPFYFVLFSKATTV